MPRSERRTQRSQRPVRSSSTPSRYSDLNLASARPARRTAPSWYAPQDNLEPFRDGRRRQSSRSAMEAYAPEPTQDANGVAEFVSSFRKKQSKERAGRKFDRQFGSSTSGASESQAGPRAAVYRGEMGNAHRRSSRMQGNPGQQSVAPSAGAKAKKSNPLVYRPAFIATAALLFCTLFACVFLYPTAQTYYQSVREHDRLEAEYQAVLERNEALSNQLTSLSTPEGLSAYAHERYGLVNPDENSVVIQGLTDQTKNGMDSVAANIIPGSVKAPETWYSPVLDVVFGVKK